MSRALGGSHNVACPSAVIGASNLFELAVANNLATGASILKTAQALGIGTGKVNRVKRSMTAVAPS